MRKWLESQVIRALKAPKNIAISNVISTWLLLEIVMECLGAGGTMVDDRVAQGIKLVRATPCSQATLFWRAMDRFGTSSRLSRVQAQVNLMLSLLYTRCSQTLPA
jgi:hypothetical protein